MARTTPATRDRGPDGEGDGDDIPPVPRQQVPQVPDDDIPAMPEESVPDLAGDEIPEPPRPGPVPPVEEHRGGEPRS